MNKKIKLMLKVELLIVVLLLIAFIVVKSGAVYLIPPCPTYTLFGILCPACQGTRCVMHFMQGDFIGSFLYHQLFFVTIIYMFLLSHTYHFGALRILGLFNVGYYGILITTIVLLSNHKFAA